MTMDGRYAKNAGAIFGQPDRGLLTEGKVRRYLRYLAGSLKLTTLAIGGGICT